MIYPDVFLSKIPYIFSGRRARGGPGSWGEGVFAHHTPSLFHLDYKYSKERILFYLDTLCLINTVSMLQWILGQPLELNFDIFLKIVLALRLEYLVLI